MKANHERPSSHVTRVRLGAVVLMVLGSLLGPAGACSSDESEGCTSDTDCKGARVCERGSCIDPEVLGLADASVRNGSGGSRGELMSCNECAATFCADEFSACDDDAACSALWDCLGDCEGDLCDECYDEYADGADLLDTFDGCVFSECAAECEIEPNEGSGGITGAGGASGGTGAGADGSGGASGSRSLSDAIEEFAQATCAKMRDCYPGLQSYLYGSYDRCVERLGLGNTWAAALPDVRLDVDYFDACSAAMSAVGCSGYLGDTPEECVSVGTRSDGSGCNAGDQCVSGFCKQEAWECGTCTPLPEVGAPCTTNGDCGSAMSCSSDGTCQKPRLQGETCSDARPCRIDFYCYDGTCAVPPAARGAQCDPDNGLSCAWMKNFTCLTDDNTCIARTWAAPGSTCGATATLHTACGRLSTCEEGQCTASPADRGSCDPSSDRCTWPAICSPGGTCMLPTDAPDCESASESR